MLTTTQNSGQSRKAHSLLEPRSETFTDRCGQFHHFLLAYMSQFEVENPYLRVIDPPASTIVLKEGKTLLMFGSNNYLGLSNHPAVKEAAKRAIDFYGTGSCSSRPLAGTTSLHVQLERELSAYKSTEETLLFSTGYMTMMGTISALAKEGDIVFSDQLNHASIIDGVRLSKAESVIYRHNDMGHLEELLASADPRLNKLIVTDGVFSMRGDLAKLPQIKELADWYGAMVMVDDAHGTGVLGEHGHGVLEHYHIEGQVGLICSTFSKVFGTVGGAVGAKKEIIDFLRFNSRPYVFTASLPSSVVATVLASLRIMKNSPQLLERLRRNVRFLRNGLKALGFDVEPSDMPIIPLFIGDEAKVLRMAAGLEREGIFVNPVIPPGVSAESSLIRISVMATHEQEELEFALEKIELVGKRTGVI